MMKSLLNILFLIFLFAVSTIAGAASKPDVEGEPPLFFPPAPNPPRLQFLAKFTSAYDVSGANKKFRNFVFGGEEAEGQVVNKPYGVEIYQGAIYVIDARGNGYVVFDVAAGEWRTVKGSGDGALQKPLNITIDKDGTRYVTDGLREVIVVFDSNDRFVRIIGEKGQFKPMDVAISGDRLYVTDILNQQVHVLNKYSGETLFTFGEPGKGPGQFAHPTSLAVGPDGTVYVSDTTNFRFQQFSADGEYLRHIGQVGTSFGSFARPKGISVDRDGRIYVVDAAFQNVQIFDEQGRVLMFFGGTTGDKRGQMALPIVVKVDYENVEHFRKYAAPGFEIEYLVIVANQYGANKVSVFGFGSQSD
jgi:DNA-binding beta-propeller fold protein YncE